MKITKRVVAMLLTVLMILSIVPLGIFAADTATGLVYESDIYEDETLNGYKQYETMWTDSTYVKADVKLSVYFDTENATATRDVIFYVINWNGERIGTDTDVDIVKDNIEAAASVESGNRAAVVVVDYGGNQLAVTGIIEASLAAIRAALPGKQALTVWSDPAAAMALDDPSTAETKTVAVHKNHVYVLPAGYRVERDILYFQTDVQSSLGTLNHVMSSWNTQIAYNPTNTTAAKRYAAYTLPKAVNYAWHTGDESCTCTANGATNECFAGAPQEKDGEIIAYQNLIQHTGDIDTCPYPHDVLIGYSGEGNEDKCVIKKDSNGNPISSNINWAPVVSRVEDCRKPDGSPMDYNCRLDIIYPSGTDVEATPVFVQAATQSPRMTNIGTTGRTALIGMTFSGYTTAVYDYAYVPMARSDHFGYIDNYGTHWQNGAKTSRAAIRCIRYFAETYGYNDDLIGVAGISKGTPTTAVLSTVDNKYVQETHTFTYTVNSENVDTRGLYYEGDLEEDGNVTAGKTVQPYMTYENGYDGVNDGDYTGTRTGEISSEVSVVYCAAGDGINWVYGGMGSNSSIMLGAEYTYTDENGEEQTRITQHVPMVLSCGYNDQYGCWNHWAGIQTRFTNYAANPFLAISMEDMGHDYPGGIDPIRNYDRYDAFNQFFHSILNPDVYTAKVAWSMPLEGTTNVALDETFQVQLIKPTENINDVTVTDNYGNVLEGKWTTNDNNTSGLYTFIPSSGWLGGTEYTVTFPTTVVATETTRTFTTEAGGVLRPVADTFVSASSPDAVHGADTTLTINNQNFYVASFATADFEDANQATLNVSLDGSATQELSVYLINDLKIDESTYCYDDLPTLTEDMLVGTYTVAAGKNALNLKDIAYRASGDNFTLIIKGSARYFELNFEDYTATTNVGEYDNNEAVVDDENASRTHYYAFADESKITPLKTRRGGMLGTRQITSYDGGMILKVPTSTEHTYGGVLKFYNTILTSVDDDVVGKTFNYSVRVKLDGDNTVAEATSNKPKVTAGIYRTGNNTALSSQALTYTQLKEDDNGWHTISGAYTVSSDEIAEKVTSTSTPYNRYSYVMFGMYFDHTNTKGSSYTYLVDDIVVSEAAPTTLVSRENTSAMTVYITTNTAPEGQPVADTYTSAVDPDKAFGNSGKLMLNGGDDESIMFLTFPASILDGKDYMDLSLPVQNDAGVEAEIYLLDGYYVDENTLTYNNMPDLSGLTPIGTYKFTSGRNTVELALGDDDVSKTCFTLVLKSTDTSCHSYFVDFDDLAVGYSLPNGAPVVTVDSVDYYYGYSDTVFFRHGSGWNTGSLVVATDPANENNHVMKSSTSGGRARLMNALSHDDVTAADLNTTYRFSFKLKDVDSTSNDDLIYGIMKAKGDHTTRYVSDTANATDAEWVTVSKDYKLGDVLTEAQATDPIAPMFFIESTAFYFDDLSVIELNSDGTEKRVLMSSGEGAETSADLISYRMRTVNDPIADTYVSAIDAEVTPVDIKNTAGTANTLSKETQKATPGSDKDSVFGQREELYISGASSHVGERVSLLTYTKDAVADGNVVILNLPTANDTSAKINIYLLDGYKIDEDTLDYTTYESDIKSNMVLVGTATLTKGNNKIELNTNGKISSDYFTLILCAADTQDHIYVSDFEKWEVGTHGNTGNKNDQITGYFYGLDSNQFKYSLEAATGTQDFMGYSSSFFYSRGSNATYGYMSVVADPDGSDNKVVEYKVKASGPRVKLLNTLSFDELTQDDVGKTYRFTFRIKATYADGTVTTASSTMGALRMYGSNYESNTATTNNSSTVNVTTNGEWHEFTYDYVVDENDLTADSNTIANHPTVEHSDPVFAIVFKNPDTSKTLYYYLDDITVVKLDDNGCEPVVTILSAENCDSEAALPAVFAQNSLVPVADTYVSRVNPNTVYGNEKTLKLGDSDGDKKVMALSFMNKALDESNYVQLNLPNSGNARKDVSVYYVMDYCIDESTLTWNTMPDYENEANLLGTYDFAAGENKLDVSSLRDKLEGDYFTLIFRTNGHSFGLNFDNYDSDQTFGDSKDNNVADTTNSAILHYHGFYTDELLAKNGLMYSLARRGGIVDNRKIAVDPDDADNQVLALSTSVTKEYGGRLKFYNSMSYEALTEADVGKTYRYTVRVRAADGNDDAVLSKLKVTASAMSSYGSTNFSSTDVATSAELQAGWVTLTVDYTVDSDDLAFKMQDSTTKAEFYAYPMFAIDLGGDGSATLANYYLLDDIKVEELVDGELVGDATFSAREGDEDVRFVSMLNGNVTIMETTVSSATEGDVFSIVDGNTTHNLLSAVDGKLVFGDKTLCDGKGVEYVLDENGIKVTAIYDDTNGTVRFAIGEKIAFYEAGKATYAHVMIAGGIGDDAVFGVDGITATKMESTTSELVGYQKSQSNDTSIRFLSGVDTLYYSAIGFDVERDGVKLSKQSNAPYVFTEINIGTETELASDYGYNYMTALVINDITTGGVIKVTPYVMIGENKVEGVSSYYKITVDGGLVLEETTEGEVKMANNADLASVTVDGDPVVGFSADVTEYNVPAEDTAAMTVVAVTSAEGATVSMSQEGSVVTITVTSFNGKVQKVYTLTAYEKLASEVVNKNGANAIVTYVFDDGDWTTAEIVTKQLSPKYDSLAGSFALITKNFGTLSTVEGEEGDGLLEYEMDVNGNYVYTKTNEDTWTKWETLLNTYGPSGFEAVSHTHTHAYIGEDDNGGTYTYKNTNGDTFTSESFPKGNVTKEYYASNQILRDLGQRAYAMVGAGLTAGGYMIDYTDNYKALPRLSGAFIGKRSTYTNPTNPSTMVNAFDSFDNEDNRFNVLSYMVQHYNTSSTAPKSTSADGYSKEACLAAGVDYWTGYVDTAVEQGGWAAFCFHNIRSDDHTGTNGHFVYQSQADALFAHTQTLSEENKVWVANLTDAMLYVFERATSEVGAYVDGEGNVIVSLDDKENDDIFTMALTVKVALPEGKTGATLNGEALTSFVEGETTYVYVDIVPGNSVTLSVQ